MIKIVSNKEDFGLVSITDENGLELKNIISADITLVGGEIPKATLEVLNPMFDLHALHEYKIMDLSDYPADYLQKLQEKIVLELSGR